ncbi:hypothetical protein [Crossiella cryophila]|uniref:Uncharacterized protein n=1 Tax=Crossiella cryophila TaxID=43355 RepID=A0A7W7CK50_9PSEU|nr:hypothetical protein [Crossiella cryophila]MBB4682442.1 hypothetical protein [Crossiella cryophila]
MEDWDEIHGFGSPGEYARFLLWIAEAVAEGALREIPVGSRYSEYCEERWYRAVSGQAWRVVGPDFPFTGAFLKVE